MERSKIFFIQRALKKRFYKYFNRLKFRIVGVSLGKSSNIYNKVYIESRGSVQVVIGDRFICTSDDNFNPLCGNRRASFFVTNGAKLIIKDGVGMSSPVIWCTKSVTIGNNAHIGANCIIIDTDVHSMDYTHRDFRNETTTDVVSKPIYIGDDVWIGVNCIILKGVKIGARSIIGAGSVVTKDVPSDCVAGGNPCKVIRTIL